MRLGGFEPPTHGLEGRCSSAELQARARKGSPEPGYLVRAPKSAVTIVAGALWYTPGALVE
jgi:hypothetical protein